MLPTSPSESATGLAGRLNDEQDQVRRDFVERRRTASVPTPAKSVGTILKDDDGPERRRHPRATIARKAAIGFADQRELVMGTAQNLSLGGVCTWGPLHAAPGDELMVLLSLKGRTIPAFATVIAAQKFGRDNVELRMRFSRLPGLSREGLLEFFRDLTPVEDAEEPQDT
jgi:hypothetical protein